MEVQMSMSGVIDAGAKKPGKLKKIGIPVLAGVLGIALGSGAGASGAQTELSELRETAAVLVADVAAKESNLEVLDGRLDTIEDERAVTVTALKDRDAEVKDLESQKVALEQRITELEAQLEQAQAQAVQPSYEPQTFAAPQAAAPAPANSYYANCTAARNAGAAPVYAGQPGYGRHLDRDGDGVGCE